MPYRLLRFQKAVASIPLYPLHPVPTNPAGSSGTGPDATISNLGNTQAHTTTLLLLLLLLQPTITSILSLTYI